MRIIKNQILPFIFGIVIILITNRGFFIAHLNFNSQNVYNMTFVLMFFISFYSFLFCLTKNVDRNLIFFKNKIIINFFILAFLSVINVILGTFIISDIYFFLIFPLALYLVRLKSIYLETFIIIVLCITILGAANFKYLSSNGYEVLLEYQNNLRPTGNALGHIKGKFQNGGFEGSHHDLSQKLVMLVIFTFIYSFYHKRFAKIFLLSLSFIGTYFLFDTASASNITVFILFFFIILKFIFKFNKKKNFIFILFLIIIFLILLKNENLFLFFVKYHDVFFNEVNFKIISFQSFFDSIINLFIGFGNYFDASLKYSEVAFIKIWLMFGLIPFLIISLILFSPIIFILRIKKLIKKSNNILYKKFESKIIDIKYSYRKLYLFSLPVIAGSVTLVHYGSLFKITSIGVWCVLLSIFFKQYVDINKKLIFLANS